MKNERIALIGALGNGEATSSGQIIRTTILYNELKRHYGESNIIVANTTLLSGRPLRFVLSFIKVILHTNRIIVILSINGMRRIWPILSFTAKVFKKKIFNNVIGGNLVASTNKYPELLKHMKTFEINWVQSVTMQKELAKRGVYNTEWLPNSKPISILRSEDIKKFQQFPLSFCTFSRVSKPKGIELAIEAITLINTKAGKELATLDVYGKPDDDYEKKFREVMSNVPEFICYKGIVPFDRSVETLKNYYMLLFPTTFNGEGFPGTIIDAYASGTPVLASSWSCNPELIIEGKTGLLYEYDRPEQLKEKIEWAIQHTDEVDSMRDACLNEAWKYTPEKVYPIIFNRIDNGGK